MLPSTSTATDPDMDTDMETDMNPNTPSTSFPKVKHNDYPYDKNNDGSFQSIDAYSPTVAPNSKTRHNDRRKNSFYSATISSPFQLDPQQETNRSSKLQTSLSKRSTSIIMALPSEILISILSNLTVEQLLPSQLVSRRFRRLARTVLLDKFLGSPHSSQHLHPANETPATATTNTFNIPTPSTLSNNPITSTNDPRRTISLYLFPDPHYTPTRCHECQTVVFECTANDRLQEVLLFQPVVSSESNNSALTIMKHPSSRQPLQAETTATAFATGVGIGGRLRSMEVETELMRCAIRFHSPAIGLNFFDYSTGQRSTSSNNSHSSSIGRSLPFSSWISPYSSSMMTLQNPYLRSLGYETTTSTTDALSGFSPITTAAGSRTQSDLLMERYSVIGVKHDGWPTLVSEDMEGGYHWSMNSRNNYVGEGGGASCEGEDEQAMLCLQAVRSEEALESLAVSIDDKVSTGIETAIGKKKRGSGMEEADIQPSKAHRHRLLQPQHHQRRGRSSKFTTYCCLHHDQYLHQNQGNKEMSQAGKKETLRTGNKDWWIEYRPIPIEAPVCQSCPQHGEHDHGSRGGGGGGVRVEFGQLRVSLDWILSGFS